MLLLDLFDRFVTGITEGIQVTRNTPRNSAETAINALADESNSVCFDSDRIEFAVRIFRIVAIKWNDIPDSTKSFAIEKLKEISSAMTFGSSKREVSKLITRIATGNIK